MEKRWAGRVSTDNPPTTSISIPRRLPTATAAASRLERRTQPMSIRAYRDIHRRKSRQIMVGKVPVGGDAPITVQTMTNTITGDARATIDQIRGIEEAGADLIRVSCPDRDSTLALPQIVR